MYTTKQDHSRAQAMDHRANLEAVGRLGRAARIGAVICLLIACALLVSSLMSANRVFADVQPPGSLTLRAF
jgi:hypothetical protein